MDNQRLVEITARLREMKGPNDGKGSFLGNGMPSNVTIRSFELADALDELIKLTQPITTEVNYLEKIDLNDPRFILVSEVEPSHRFKHHVAVLKEKANPNCYHIWKDGEIRHPGLDAEGAMRALSFYMA